MSRTVGQLLTSTLGDLGATQVFGVVGDALNAFTDAIRQDDRMSWIGVRHEEGAALAAVGQAKLTGRWLRSPATVRRSRTAASTPCNGRTMSRRFATPAFMRPP